MSNTTLLKVTTQKNTAVEKQMSYVDALEIIEKQDGKIKSAAKNRLPRIGDTAVRLHSRNMVKSLGIAGVGVSSFIFMGITGNLDSLDAAIGSLSTALVGMAGGTILPFTNWYSRLLSPIKYKEFREEYKAHENLRQLKEAEFKKLEDKALKKASLALNVANKTLAGKSKEVSYTRTLGEEGFSVKAIIETGEIAQERLRAISEAEQNALEPPAQDALCATSAKTTVL